MTEVHRVCFVDNTYRNAATNAHNLLGSQTALENFRLLGPSGFYHSVVHSDGVRWEVLLLADIHQNPDDVPQLLENNRNLKTAMSMTDFIRNKLTNDTCLDLFIEQRKNTPQDCSKLPTGYLSITKCDLQAQCKALYINDDIPNHAVSCVNTDSRVRLHALDFRTSDGIPAYMERIQANPPAQLPEDLTLLWKSVANAVVFGAIQPAHHILWYTCSDRACLTAYYLALLKDLHRSYTASTFYTDDSLGFETQLGDCLIQFYRTVTHATVQTVLSNLILSIDARLFDLSYIFNMFRADTYSTTTRCDSRHRNVLLYAGYQHIQFVQLLIQYVFKRKIQTQDGDLREDPAFVLSKTSTKDGLGSGFAVTMMQEPFRQQLPMSSRV